MKNMGRDCRNIHVDIISSGDIVVLQEAGQGNLLKMPVLAVFRLKQAFILLH